MPLRRKFYKIVKENLNFPGKTLNNKKCCLFIVILLIYISGHCRTHALQCYTCTFTETETDNSCLLTPKAFSKITNCSMKYCTIMRQEAVSPAGKVISFIRDCQDKPLFLNAVKVDPTFKTYYRSCVSDLCNDSDGTHSATHIDPNFGASENTIIKGKSFALPKTTISNTINLLSLLITLGLL